MQGRQSSSLCVVRTTLHTQRLTQANATVHLHGHKFQIVRIATDVSSNDTTLNPPHTEGAANPMRRDTINVPGEGGAVNVRFVADNPGAWLLHCHIEWHFEAGLAVVFIEAPTQAQEEMKIPQVMLDQCAMLDVPSTGVRLFSTHSC